MHWWRWRWSLRVKMYLGLVEGVIGGWRREYLVVLMGGQVMLVVEVVEGERMDGRREEGVGLFEEGWVGGGLVFVGYC